MKFGDMGIRRLGRVHIVLVVLLFALCAVSNAWAVDYNVTADANGNGTGTVSSSPVGISYSYNAFSTGSTSIAETTLVTLTATAGTDSTVSWTSCPGGAIGGDASLAFCTYASLDGNKTAVATFTLKNYTVTAKATGSQSGTVTSNTGGISYIYPGVSTADTTLIDHGTAVTLTATVTTPATMKVSWTTCTGTVAGNGTASATCTYSPLDGDKTAEATFSLNQYNVTANAAGNGAGTVTSDSGGINYTYLPTTTASSTPITVGTTVTLTATAATGSTVFWTACTGTKVPAVPGNFTTATCTYPFLDGDKTAEATFTLNQYTVTANANGNGSGTVTSNTGGISYTYNADNTETTNWIDYGTAVTLTANVTTPATMKVSWTTCTGTVAGNDTASATCTYASLDGNKTAIATFTNYVEYCVENSDELQAALTAAQADGNHNLIKVVQGEIPPGNALSFDGALDYVVIPRNIQDNFTIEFWVKTTQSGGAGHWYNGFGLVDGEVGGITNDFGTALVGNKFAFGIGEFLAVDTTITSTTDINDGIWHHVAAVRTGSSGLMEVYVDGVFENSVVAGTHSLTAPPVLNIGRLQTLINYFNGTIDEVRIWNVARTAAEIQDKMNVSLAGNEAGLVNYYRMDQGVPGGINTSIPSLKNDLIPAVYDGTLNNFARTGSTSNFVLNDLKKYVGNFTYSSIENADLYIQGGYNSGCVSRTADPTLTLLDGGNITGVIELTTTGTGSITLEGFTVTNGQSNGDGGCISISTKQGEATVTGNIVAYCTADGGGSNGGGISVDTTTGKAILTNNIVHHNSATFSGGGIYAYTDTGSIVILNNTVADNEAFATLPPVDGQGGGVSVFINTAVVTVPVTRQAYILNNIIRGNRIDAVIVPLSENHDKEDVFIKSDGDGGDHAVVVFNRNDAQLVNGVYSTDPNFKTDLDPDLFPLLIPLKYGTGNIDAAPQFIGIHSTDDIFRDYHIHPTSLCKDRGDGTHADLPETDIDGQPRVKYNVVDMGADEVEAAAVAPAILIVPVKATGSVTLSAGTSPTPGATYIFEYKKTTDVTWTSYNSGSVTNPTITGLTAGTYQFRVYVTAPDYDDSVKTNGSSTCVVTTAAAAPVFLTVPATSTNGTLRINWGVSSTAGATYVVEESTDAFATVSEVYRGVLTSTILTGRSNNTYNYRVKAIKTGLTDSAWKYSSNVTGCVVSVSAGTPASLTVPAASTNGSISLSWAASSTAGVTYVVEESTSAGFSTKTEVYRGALTTVTLTGRANSTYYYRVKAIKTGLTDSSWRNGSNACLVSALAGTPSSMVVPATSTNGSIRISWGTSSTSGVTYVLEESASTGFFTKTEVYRGNLSSLTLTGRTNGTYYYRVKAVKTGLVDSAWRNGSNGCVVSVPVGTPAFINVPSGSTTGTISINWGTSSTAGVTYVVEESPYVSFITTTQVYRGAMGSVTLYGRANGKYYYRVKAIKAGMTDSAWKNGSNGCEVGIPVGTPASITVPATSTTGSISISWGASSTAGVTYVVEQSTYAGFLSTTQVYRGSQRSITLTGRAKGTYYYRVKAVKMGSTDSGWKNGSNSCVVK